MGVRTSKNNPGADDADFRAEFAPVRETRLNIVNKNEVFKCRFKSCRLETRLFLFRFRRGNSLSIFPNWRDHGYRARDIFIRYTYIYSSESLWIRARLIIVSRCVVKLNYKIEDHNLGGGTLQDFHMDTMSQTSHRVLNRSIDSKCATSSSSDIAISSVKVQLRIPRRKIILPFVRFR